MTHAALAIYPESNTPDMSAAQRSCILHILRNCAGALEGLTLFLEQSDTPPSPADLHGCLRGVVRTLAKMDDAFKRDSFCALSTDECSFVAAFVGCKGEPK